MLRVCYSDSPSGQRWTICGGLAGPWVEELRACWRQHRERVPGAHAVVDLKEVVFIDEEGERLLAEMAVAGAELVAAGVENKHVIATLRNAEGHRICRRLEDLCGRSEEMGKPNGGEQ